jgi:hypothetical protein
MLELLTLQHKFIYAQSMSPEELGTLHPKLYHVTLPGMSESIRMRGLLSTSKLLDLCGVSGSDREQIEHKRRPSPVPIHHPTRGTFTINDQLPMTEQALLKCLDDGLAPSDWLALLNGRVFFWPDEDGLARLLGARANRKRALEVIVVDTRSLANAHAHNIELSPINSGATIRKPARRGLSTFTPLLALSYQAWSKKRGGRDKITEVTVVGGVPDIETYITEVRAIPASKD